MQHRSRSERKDKKEKVFFAPSHNSKSGFTIESNWHVFACQNAPKAALYLACQNARKAASYDKQTQR